MRHLVLLRVFAAMGSLAGNSIAKKKGRDRYPSIIVGGLAGALVGNVIYMAFKDKDDTTFKTIK